MKITARACAIFILTATCAFRAFADPPADDDRAVLQATLAALCAQSGPFDVLSNSAAQLPLGAGGEQQLNGEALGDMRQRNAASSHLPADLGCPAVHPADEEAIAAALRPPAASGRPGGWDGFYASFAGARGLIRLSLPGYSKAGDVAVVYMSSACRGFCGAGFYYELHRVKGAWSITRRSNAWVT